jgi:sporulation protein YlmC with PRC-barrel domain
MPERSSDMRRIGLVPAIALVGFLVEFCGGPVHAQGKFDLEDWDYDELRTGWSVERLTEAAEVVDPDGEKVGEVEDLIAGPDGKIRKLVIEAGGFLDVGDAHLAYPFEQATFEGSDRIVVELDQDKIGDYSLFADGDDEPAQGRNWRVSELIHDYVYLEDGYRFGWIKDAIISADGTIKAVVVYPDVTAAKASGPVALPFLPEEDRFDPALYYYQVPFSEDAVSKLGVFFYDQMETHTPMDAQE